MAAQISTCTLNPLKHIQAKFRSDVKFPLWSPHSPLLPISILQKHLQIYLLFGTLIKTGCNDLYFHPLPFHMYHIISYIFLLI